MEKVSLNGVEIYPFTSEGQLLSFVDEHKGILVAINAEKILHATEQTRGIINRNIGYCDGAGAQLALKQKGYKEACKVPGCELWLKIVARFSKEKTFYLVGGKPQVIEETDGAYWQIVSLVNREKLAGQYVETLKRFARDVEALYENGMSTKADLLSVRVRLNQAEMALLRVQDGLGLARMALNRLCGLPLDTVFALQEEDLKQTVLPERMELEEVYANRPEIHSLSLAADIYRRKERIARSEYLPSVALTANYMAMTPSFFDGISNKLDGMWSVGIGVKAPIFHWGASRKSVRSARAETELMELKLEEAKEMVELQVSQAHFKVEEAMHKMKVAESNLSRADENLRYANLGFEEGTMPVLNVLEAQTAWLEAHTEGIDARIELKLCEVYLKKAYGVLSK